MKVTSSLVWKPYMMASFSRTSSKVSPWNLIRTSDSTPGTIFSCNFKPVFSNIPSKSNAVTTKYSKCGMQFSTLSKHSNNLYDSHTQFLQFPLRKPTSLGTFSPPSSSSSLSVPVVSVMDSYLQFQILNRNNNFRTVKAISDSEKKQRSFPVFASLKNSQETEKLDISEDEMDRLDKELSELQNLSDVASQGDSWMNKREYPCTADELHYVSSGDWRLALWRYKPPPHAPKRNHPVLMLCGVATNAVGYDIHPDISLARHLRDNGFDTWTLEVRGAGLSHLAEEEDKPPEEKMLEIEAVQDRQQGGSDSHESTDLKIGKTESNGLSVSVKDRGRSDSSGLNDTVDQMNDQLELLVEDDQKNGLSEKFGEMREILGGLLEEANQRTALSGRISDLAEGIKSVLNEDQKTVISSKLSDLRARLATLAEEGQKVGESLKVNELVGRLKKVLDDSQKSVLTERIGGVRESLSNLLGEGQKTALSGRISDLVERLTKLLDDGQKSSVTERISELRKKLEVLLEESQSARSPRADELRGRVASIFNETQKTLELIRKYDWDFDTILYEDIPAAMKFVVEECKPVDGKLLAVGHSMGGIGWFAHLAAKGDKSGVAAAVAIASSMDYSPSNSSLKLVLPLATPAKLTSVPVVPMGILARTALPFIMGAPYTLAWVGYQISARNMMDPSLMRKLLMHNFDTIPVKLLLQLATLFYGSGLKNRDGTVQYIKGLRDCQVPLLALAGDQDWICPPKAVTETVKLFPEGIVTYRLFGGENGRSYSHYDLLAGRHAKDEVFPTITDFLVEHDELH